MTRALETAADRRTAPCAPAAAGPTWCSARTARRGSSTAWSPAGTSPEASHLLLLEAVAGPDLVRAAYAAASRAGYLWHEFGDSCLLLP